MAEDAERDEAVHEKQAFPFLLSMLLGFCQAACSLSALLALGLFACCWLPPDIDLCLGPFVCECARFC